MIYYKLKNITNKKTSFFTKTILSLAFIIQSTESMEEENSSAKEDVLPTHQQSNERFDFFAGETPIIVPYGGDDSDGEDVFDYFKGEKPIFVPYCEK